MPLAAQDKANLEQWYTQHDRGETETFARAVPLGDLVKLREDVDRALAQLRGVTHRVSALADENEALKQEISTLQRQLKQNAQPA